MDQEPGVFGQGRLVPISGDRRRDGRASVGTSASTNDPKLHILHIYAIYVPAPGHVEAAPQGSLDPS